MKGDEMDTVNIQEAFHLRDYVDIIRRRRDIAIIFLVTIVVVVATGNYIITPVHRATTTLLIDVESPNVLTTSGTVALESQNYFSYKEYYQSQIEIITSEAIAKRVFDEFGLGNMREYSRAKEPIKKFLKTVKVEPVRDTRLFRLYVENKDPELAAKLANRIAEIYVRRNLSYISKNELLNLLKNEYLKLETKISEYSKVYKEGHPEMIRIKKEMAELIDKIENEKKSLVTHDIDIADTESAYRYALEGLKANNISILTLAEKPILPIRPKKLMNVLIAIIVGLFGGIGLVFFFEYMDDTVKDVDDIERLVQWPFLGSIPFMDVGGKMSTAERDIFVHMKPKDPISEIYKVIRTGIIFSSTEEHPLKSIIVTSPGPEEGKTITLCNIGIVMAQNQKRVLLVDSDIRRPSLHEIFKAKAEKGLSDFLSGQARFDELVQKTDIDNIFLVSGGFIPPNPSELLAGIKMKEFVETAKGKFEFIIFDTPPMAMITDAVILSRVVDGVIMVIESGKTSKRALPRIHRLLSDAKARVIGVLLNKASMTSGSYYYYSYSYDKPRK